ncbi:MAG: hypothetical protein RLO51_24260 [Thalassobaculum sp.]|uniref:hypothetical protein n=1 Tax=Thalassobaculum sp. TaxID=2022740 RepID=UPI0032EC7494
MIRFLKRSTGQNLVHRLKEDIGDPAMAQLLDSWLRVAPDDGLPDKALFDPLDHPTLLPRMWIYELMPDRSDFVCRLSGEEIRHVWGQTNKGMTLSRLSSPQHFRPGHRRWLYCVTAPAVLLGRSIEQERFVVHRLSLPFTDNTGRRYLIGASRYDFDHIDPYADRDPFRYSQYAVAVRAVDLIRSARDQEDDGQAASSSRTWAAQASPRA